MILYQMNITHVSMPLAGYLNAIKDVALERPLGQGSI